MSSIPMMGHSQMFIPIHLVGISMPTRGQEIIRAIERAQDQTETLEAREAALEELKEEGIIGESETVDDVRDAEIEAELNQLKKEMQE